MDTDACLAVKGSRVQIPPSRRFFDRSYPKMGTRSALLVPVWAGWSGNFTVLAIATSGGALKWAIHISEVPDRTLYLLPVSTDTFRYPLPPGGQAGG